MSVAGGYHNAIVAAEARACGTVQLFTKNANQWQGKELTEVEVTLETKGPDHVEQILARLKKKGYATDRA